MMTPFRSSVTLAAALVAILAGTLRAAPQRPPNFVILLADDLGYGDLSCYGHPTIRTPHLDRLAAEGSRWTQFYSAAAVCTPSRAALLTGRYQIRSGMTFVIHPRHDTGLPPEEITLAEALKPRGYATACIGKWHLGHRPEHQPRRHGFDRYYGLLYSNDMNPLSLYRDEEAFEDPVEQSTLTERYTQEAMRFVSENRERPFLLYLPYTMPHVPLHAGGEFKGRSRRGLYGDVVETIDACVGKLVEHIDKLGLGDNTLILFSSDNGPWTVKGLHSGSTGGLRGGKRSGWEGGIRVPLIARWKGRIPAGQISHEIGINTDIFATCLALADVPLPSDRPMDGVDLTPALTGQGRVPERTLFFYIEQKLFAARRGPWKLHQITCEPYRGKETVHQPPLLFNLEEDPYETTDVAKEHPEVIAQLSAEMEAFAQAATQPAR